MTVVLELLGRPARPIDEAFRGHAPRRATLDLDAVYGNLLGGNVAGILVDVGRWAEARELQPPGDRLEPGRRSRSSTRSSTS